MSEIDYAEQIRVARKAETCLSYLQTVISRYEVQLLKGFAEMTLTNDEDIKNVIVLKHHYDALGELKTLVESDINQGKVAQKMLDQLNKG